MFWCYHKCNCFLNFLWSCSLLMYRHEITFVYQYCNFADFGYSNKFYTVFRMFYLYNHVRFNQKLFLPFQLDVFIYFSCLIALARTFHYFIEQKCWQQVSLNCSSSYRKHFQSFFIESVNCWLFIDALYYVRKLPFIPSCCMVLS